MTDISIIRAPHDIERFLGPFRQAECDSRIKDRHEAQGYAQSLQVITPGRILLPIDITRCPLEVFSFINKFAGDHRLSAILLYVVNLNVLVPENRIIEDLSHSAEQHLKRLSEKFLPPDVPVRLRVRVGKPAEEILAEAKDSIADWIVVTSYGGSSFWKRPFQPRIVEKVLRAAPCNVSLLHVRTRFNCEEDWNAADDIVSALDYTGLLNSSLSRGGGSGLVPP